MGLILPYAPLIYNAEGVKTFALVKNAAGQSPPEFVKIVFI
jgi:hypothetical protein